MAKPLALACLQAALESLLVCGGGSAVPGLAPRLVRELHSRLLSATAPKLLQLPEYMPPHTLACASWMGGAVLAKVGRPSGFWAAPAA